MILPKFFELVEYPCVVTKVGISFIFMKPYDFNFAYSLPQDAMRSSTTRQPLREVKVQCNLTAEPLPTCPSCSSVDWER